MGVGRDREKLFDSAAWWLHRHSVRPDHISFLQIPIYVAMIYAGYRANDIRYLWAFGILQIVVTIIDGADGILARRTGTVSRRGHLLDELLDIIGIGITIWAVARHHPALAQWLLGLLVVNFLVYLQNEIQGTKSITYTRGPLTIAFVFEYYYPNLLTLGIAIPLLTGVVLLFSRVAWRRRIWTYYQFLTAGRREEYKATPRERRIELLAHDPRYSPGTPRPSEPSRAPRGGPMAEEEVASEPEGPSP